ncbi:MAG: YtxH domain-containing protein [Candidatus Melainabacteria bacterium]|nr:YtxH domain-containing protein [Candidatus Melainabacteria bacterium]
MSKKEGSFLKFVFGMFSGLVSGLIIGLLIAPKAGKEMREDLVNKSRELKEITKDKLSGKASQVATTIQERASKISSRLDELSKRGSEVLIQDEVQ